MKLIAGFLFIVGFFSPCLAQTEIKELLKKGNQSLYENPDEAIAIGEKILLISNVSLENKVDALLLITTGYSSKRNYVKSLSYAVQASQLLPKIENDEFKIIIYSRLGVQYQQLKIYDKAHSYLDKAIQIANISKQKINRDKLLGFNYGIRGLVYKEQMSCELAQNYFNKSLFHYKKALGESIMNANISVIIYNKGNCFIALNQIDSAKICFENSYRYADKIKGNSLKAFAHKGLAEVNALEGNYKKALELLLDAQEMSKDVGDLVLNQSIYKGLADNYFVLNNVERNKFYLNKLAAITANIKSNESKTINQFVLQIENDKMKEVRQIKLHALYVILPLILCIILMIVILYLQNSKYLKRQNSLKIERENLEKTAFK